MLDPGGMVVDLLRRPYRSRMVIGTTGRETTVRWYFTLPGALILPFPTAFSSSVFRDVRDPVHTGPGEPDDGRIATVRGDLAPRGAGLVPIGSPEQFHSGIGPALLPHPAIPKRKAPVRRQTLDGINLE